MPKQSYRWSCKPRISVSCSATIALMTALAVPPAMRQDNEDDEVSVQETVVVTGSFIQRNPADSA